MARAHLLSSAARAPLVSLLDANGDRITPRQRAVPIRDLPLIAADALPPLPKGMEARLLVGDIERGILPEIVLFCPDHEVSVCVPLDQKQDIPTVAVELVKRIAQATAPEPNAIRPRLIRQ